MRALFFIIALLIVSCGKQPQPNQDLLSAYELIKKGEFYKANIIAENAPLKNDADSSLFCIVVGAVAVANLDFDYSDSCAVEKCIKYYDDDYEKLGWAYLLKSVICYNFGSWDDAIVCAMTAEKLSENVDCDELKFWIYDQLASLNIDSYNTDYYDVVINKLQKYAVNDYSLAVYYSYKSFGYKIGRMASLDSARHYAQKSVEYADNAGVTNMTSYSSYSLYAELMFDKDDSVAEVYAKKALEIDTLRDMTSLLGRIYLKRGELDSANNYFAKAIQGRFDSETVGNISHWLCDFYVRKQDYENAYNFALKRIAAKDSVINYLEINNIKPIQAKFEIEIEQLKLKSALEKKILLIILIAAVLLAVLVSALFYQKSKLAERSRKIFEAQQIINSYNQKISELTSKKQNPNAEEIDFLRQKVKALELKFSEIYTNGKNLYAHVLADNKIGRWSKEDYRNFIDYYQSLEFLYVRSFDTDFVNLTDRQKIFLILCHIGKSKEQIMHIMTLEESSFRSMKSRIEGQRNKGA